MDEKHLNRIIQEGDLESLEKELRNDLSVDFTFQESCSSSDSRGYTLLDLVVATRRKEVVQFLVDRGADVRRMRNWPGATKELIDSFSLQNTCMYPCLVRGDVEIASILVKAGFDVNLQDMRQCSSLWHAVDSGNCEMVDAVLCSPTVNVDLHDMTYLHPLHVAALHGYSKLVTSLLQKGANANAMHVFGNTPLILASKNNSYDSVRQLLLYGANVNSANIYGVTPLSKFLHNPTTHQDLRIIDLLLNAGALVFDSELKEWREQEDLQIFLNHPQIYKSLKQMSSKPPSLKIVTGKSIRLRIMEGFKRTQNIDIYSRINKLQLPHVLKQELLLQC